MNGVQSFSFRDGSKAEALNSNLWTGLDQNHWSEPIPFQYMNGITVIWKKKQYLSF